MTPVWQKVSYSLLKRRLDVNIVPAEIVINGVQDVDDVSLNEKQQCIIVINNIVYNVVSLDQQQRRQSSFVSRYFVTFGAKIRDIPVGIKTGSTGGK